MAVFQYDFIYKNRQSQNNYKMQNYKTLDDNVGENLDGPGYGDDCLYATSWPMKEIINVRLC